MNRWGQLYGNYFHIHLDKKNVTIYEKIFKKWEGQRDDKKVVF